VEFIVIGGQADYLFGSPRVTYDVDLCYRRTRANLERLAAALKEIKPTLRGAPPDLPIVLDVQAFFLGSNYTFDTDFGELDLLGWVEPLGDYEALARHAEVYRVGDLELKVIGLDDLIRVREHIGRTKDRDSLYQLLAIKRLRQEGADKAGG
jgi:predicted nucleotidyltransferase